MLINTIKLKSDAEMFLSTTLFLKSMFIFSVVVIALFFSVVAHTQTAGSLLSIDDAELQSRYYALIGELRCPKCQNQNLADSDAPIATDLRQELQRLLQEGYSDTQILEFMTARYGNFVLYEPPMNQHTLMLWFIPPALLLLGLLILVTILRRAKKSSSHTVEPQLSDSSQEGADALSQKVIDLLDKRGGGS